MRIRPSTSNSTSFSYESTPKSRQRVLILKETRPLPHQPLRQDTELEARAACKKTSTYNDTDLHPCEMPPAPEQTPPYALSLPPEASPDLWAATTPIPTDTTPTSTSTLSLPSIQQTFTSHLSPQSVSFHQHPCHRQCTDTFVLVMKIAQTDYHCHAHHQ